MTRTGQINSTTRPVAYRVVDGSEFHVELDLTGVADTILDQIALVLHREHRIAQLMLLGNPLTTPTERAEIRAQLRAALTLARAFDVPMFAPQADELASDLWEATTEPTLCEGACGGENYATRPDGLCEDDGEAADVAESVGSHLRSVS